MLIEDAERIFESDIIFPVFWMSSSSPPVMYRTGGTYWLADAFYYCPAPGSGLWTISWDNSRGLRLARRSRTCCTGCSSMPLLLQHQDPVPRLYKTFIFKLNFYTQGVIFHPPPQNLFSFTCKLVLKSEVRSNLIQYMTRNGHGGIWVHQKKDPQGPF